MAFSALEIPDVEITQVRLAETFLGIAESLRKPRGSLMR
jgi:hypothetical protein